MKGRRTGAREAKTSLEERGREGKRGEERGRERKERKRGRGEKRVSDEGRGRGK